MNPAEPNSTATAHPPAGAAAASPPRSAKRFLKSLSGAAVRGFSYALPARFLFRSFLLARRFELRLRKAGSPRPLQKAVDHIFYSLRPALVRTTFRGRIFYVRLNDPFHYDLLLEDHEPAVTDWLARNLKPGMTIFDVGANIGSYALFLAGLVGEQGRVVALEADPDVARILEANVQANGLKAILPIQAAAFRESGEILLGRARASTGYSGLYYSQAAEWISVPACTLDALGEKLGLKRLDFVKIDVEGAECDVLEGMTSLLRTHRPVLLIELHPDSVPQVREIPGRLRAEGYSVEALTPTHVVAHPR